MAYIANTKIFVLCVDVYNSICYHVIIRREHT